ncbi:MAG TPA: Spy/CpxP family protein refolding chaperone [Syntrophorhabdaceae bacterium]|nr:Spy/CpxP family protein refolding chaperone [Syntrophorhabdaceae bacterium]
MKIRKRFAVFGSMVGIILVLMVAGIAVAGCGQNSGPFAGWFHRFHVSDRDMSGFILKRLDRKIKELSLTPTQKTKYDEFRAQLKAQMLAAKEDRKQFKEAVRDALAKESPDVAMLTAMMKKKIESASVTLQADLDLFASFYSTLDQGQKQKVIAGIQKRIAARDACREEGQ